MSLWRELVSDNPMTVEMKRFRNRFFTPGRMPVFNTLILILGGIGFFILTLVALNIPYFGAEAILYIEASVVSLLVPAMTHGTIASEREKRTWDVLMTAPVSMSQVVVGKFIGAAMGTLILWVLFWIPMLLAYVNNLASSSPSAFYQSTQTAFWALVCCKIDILLYGWTLAAFCILISARSRRAFSAFFLAFGAAFFALVIGPSFLGTVVRGATNGTFLTIALSWHPFIAIQNTLTLGQVERFSSYNAYDENPLNESFVGAITVISPIFFSLFFLVIFLMWAIKTVRFIDFDTRFLPRSKDASSN